MFTNYIHTFYIQKIYTFCIPNFIYTDIRIYPKYPKYPNLSKNIQKYPKFIQKYPKIFIITYGINLLKVYILLQYFLKKIYFFG